MFAGDLPFSGTDDACLNYPGDHRPYRPMQGPVWAGVSAGAKHLIGKMLEADVAARYSVNQVEAGLTHVQAGSGVCMREIESEREREKERERGTVRQG